MDGGDAIGADEGGSSDLVAQLHLRDQHSEGGRSSIDGQSEGDAPDGPDVGHVHLANLVAAEVQHADRVPVFERGATSGTNRCVSNADAVAVELIVIRAGKLDRRNGGCSLRLREER